MATSVEVSSGGLSFYNTADSQSGSGLFLSDNGSIGFGTLTTFDDNSSCTISCTWSDPCSSSCCSEESTFSPAVAFSFEIEDSPPAPDYPTEEDMVGLDASWMQPVSSQPVMHPTLVHTLKNVLVTPTESSSPVEDEWAVFHQDLEHSSLLSPPSSDGSLTSQKGILAEDDSDEDAVQIKHEPPPLNMKRLEKVENPVNDDIEAAEVSVDLIQNRRPFQCGLAGCNKTFKNPQTMKMHHKTHYSDGSAIVTKDGVASLPTLTPVGAGLKAAGQNNKKIPSRCPKCRKTFVGLYELRRHYGRKHSEGEKPFGCRKCDKRFYIEVDVRDHEKLCGEPIECKCGLKFAFKCNLVAHKKAHPACQENYSTTEPSPPPPPPSYNATYPDEDSSSISTPITRGNIKRRGPEITRPAPPSKQAKYVHSGPTPPVPFSKGVPQVGASSTFKAGFYDFAELRFSTEGGSLWGSNMHYPSINFATLPSIPLPGVLGGLEQLGNQIFNSRPKLQIRTDLTSTTRPMWSSIQGL